MNTRSKVSNPSNKRESTVTLCFFIEYTESVESMHEPALITDQLHEWSNWLSLHHADTPFVWIKIRRVKGQCLGLSLGDAVNEAIRWGWIDGLMHPCDSDGFWLRFSPRKPNSVWSITNLKRAQAHLANGTMMPSGLRTVEWAKQNGWWSIVESSEDPTSKETL
jgi:uncharacterized protein YdeI (YjbR/CyaY-like superfamily)